MATARSPNPQGPTLNPPPRGPNPEAPHPGPFVRASPPCMPWGSRMQEGLGAVVEGARQGRFATHAPRTIRGTTHIRHLKCMHVPRTFQQGASPPSGGGRAPPPWEGRWRTPSRSSFLTQSRNACSVFPRALYACADPGTSARSPRIWCGALHRARGMARCRESPSARARPPAGARDLKQVQKVHRKSSLRALFLDINTS